MRVRVLGVGMGPHHVTAEVADALRSCDYAVAARKSADDGLLAVRREICRAHHLEVAEVDDPPRDRDDPEDYPAAVAAWHRARIAAYEDVLRERGGTAAFLVWGDPSLYDSTIRIVEELATRLPLEYDVLPGVSAPQLLAARHRIVLHQVGQPRARHDRAPAGRRCRRRPGQHRGHAGPSPRPDGASPTGRSGGAPTSAPTRRCSCPGGWAMSQPGSRPPGRVRGRRPAG